MTIIRRITVSQIDGNDANANNTDEIRPFGETAFYLDTEQNPDALTLMVFDGVRTHVRSKVLRPGVLYGSNENSSDGNGFDTIKLIPDSFLDWNSEYQNDQYIIIEPTVGEPGHIHIRSGGTIDQSTADLFLGGELNHVKISDTNNAVIISTDAGVEGDTREWEFDASGYLQFPGSSNGKIGEGIIPGLVVYSDLSFCILTNLANTENSRAWIFEEDGSLTFPGDTSISDDIEGTGHFGLTTPANTGFTVITNDGDHQWSFGVDGGLTFPDTTEQTTAFTISPTLNVLKIDDGVHEKFQTKADATGTVTHDCASGHVFYHTSPDANWTANFTNLNLNTGYVTAVSLVIVQGATGYYPNAVQIGGAAQTINWQGNATPTASSSRTDVVTFSILNNAGTYTVLGQLTGF
jgi:hypothetical protein